MYLWLRIQSCLLYCTKPVTVVCAFAKTHSSVSRSPWSHILRCLYDVVSITVMGHCCKCRNFSSPTPMRKVTPILRTGEVPGTGESCFRCNCVYLGFLPTTNPPFRCYVDGTSVYPLRDIQILVRWISLFPCSPSPCAVRPQCWM